MMYLKIDASLSLMFFHHDDMPRNLEYCSIWCEAQVKLSKRAPLNNEH